MTSYVGWREFEAPLLELQRNDPEVGRNAERMLEDLKLYHWKNV